MNPAGSGQPGVNGGTDAGARNHSYGASALYTPANLLTLCRIALAPVAFWMMQRNISSWPLWGLWLGLSLSDMADGYLARRMGTTRSGAFLDPLADKVLVLGGQGAMAMAGRFGWFPVVLQAVREAVISIMRWRFARRGLAVPASKLGKWKAFTQLGAVGWVTWPGLTRVTLLADSFLWAGVVLSLVSGGQYLRDGASRATAMED